MPPRPPAPSWDLDGPLGRETWVGPPGAFDHVLLDGVRLGLAPRDGTLSLLRARGATCAHPGPWPFGFRFCPECGAHLQAPPPERLPEQWSSPPGTGLPPTTCRGTPDPSARAALPMPGPARLDWGVAGTPPRLLAVDQISGRVHAWADGTLGPEGTWSEIAHLGPALNLPRWSFGNAAFAFGVALPMDAGPVFLGVHGVKAEAASANGRCLGGAGAIGTTALIPVQAGAGLALARWSTEAPGWEIVPVPDAPAQELFAAPSLGAAEAIWPGRHGQLQARIQGGRLTCEYRPWRDDWQPMLAVRPVLSPDGVFHQLGRQDGHQSFEALLPPGATPQRRPFDRYVTSAGAVTFMGAARHREPWEPKRLEYRADGNAFLLPLLPFDQDRVLIAACTPRTALRSFIETEPDVAEPVECRIMFAGASIVPTDLGMVIRARSAADITALVYRGTLLVYDAARNTCCTWPLRHD